MQAGTREFATPEVAEASPLAQAIFDTGEVTNVFFGADFVSVTAAPGVNWNDLKPIVVSILLDHFVSEAPLFAGGDASGIAVPQEAELLVEESADDEDIILQGACSGCPSSTATLKHGIEGLLKHYVPEVVEVRAA